MSTAASWSAVPGRPVAFRGTVAVAAGVVTPAMLRGPRFLRVFPDTFVRRGSDPPDLALRSRAAAVYVAGRGVASGYSAAELLGASCGPERAPAEVTVPGGGQRDHPGLLVHRDVLAPDEVATGRFPPTTTPLRTGSASSTRAPTTADRSACCATPGATPGWSTRGGGCTGSRGTRSARTPTGSPRRSGERWA